jgi:hypothetical protein
MRQVSDHFGHKDLFQIAKPQHIPQQQILGDQLEDIIGPGYFEALKNSRDHPNIVRIW